MGGAANSAIVPGVLSSAVVGYSFSGPFRIESSQVGAPVGAGERAAILAGSPEVLWPLPQSDLQLVISGAALKYLLMFLGAGCDLRIWHLCFVLPVVSVTLVYDSSDLGRSHPPVASVT